MSTKLGTVEKSLPIMLLRAREAVMARFRPMLKAHGLSEQQWRVLRVLNEGGPSEPTRLAAESVILMPSLTRILAHLDSEGLITRNRHEDDGRRQIAELTAKGSALIARIAPESAAIYAAIEAEFGSDDIDALMAALHRLTGQLHARA